MLWALLTFGIVLDHAHLVSPVATAWSNTGFRQIMLRRPEKFVLLPIGLLVFGVIFGLETTRRDPSFQILVAIYLLWNSYHFGMQNFGLMALWGYRGIGFAALCATMLAMSVLPISAYGSAPGVLVLLMALSFWHWVSDIGLSAFVSRYRWVFLGGVLFCGLLGFFVKGVRDDQILITAGPAILSIRVCAGFVHFLYSRWVWRFSDPQVRATIGADLFNGRDQTNVRGSNLRLRGVLGPIRDVPGS